MASTIPFFPGGLRPDSGGLAQSTDGFGKGDGGGGGPGPLPWRFQTGKLELLTAGLGQPVPLAYGRHLVGGNVIFIKKNLDKSRTVFVALGEGEWNAVEAVTVNGRGFNIYDSKRFHFHPGLDGELGVESDPAVRNQKICSLFPPRFVPQITFSRLAYISMRIPRPVWRKVGPFIEVAGVYETTRVRIFDNVGNQTAYQYSTNPAWIALDILIRRFIKPVGKINEALTTAEKNRINFQAFKDWADFCDFDIGGGTKRFEASIAYVDIADLLRALNH
ncbi:MAG: hypothetical protein ACE5HB_09635, partial [Terriglobia bacterium]